MRRVTLWRISCRRTPAQSRLVKEKTKREDKLIVLVTGLSRGGDSTHELLQHLLHPHLLLLSVPEPSRVLLINNGRHFDVVLHFVAEPDDARTASSHDWATVAELGRGGRRRARGSERVSEGGRDVSRSCGRGHHLVGGGEGVWDEGWKGRSAGGSLE